MLSLSGNSEQAFAQLNSINMNPVAYAEWNYNAVLRPYAVWPSADNPISTNMNSAVGWTSTNGSVIQDYTSGGYVSETDPNSGKAVLISLPSNSFSDTVTTSFNITGPGYYKIILYVRSNQKNTVGVPAILNSSDIAISAATTGVGTKYYYSIVPVSSAAETLLVTQSNSASIQTDSASVNLSWPSRAKDAYYHIYAGTSPTKTPYLASTSNNSYVHLVNTRQTSWYPEPFLSQKFYMNPVVRLYDGANYLEDTKFYCKVYDEKAIDPDYISSTVEFDGSKFYKVEITFGSDNAFSSVALSLPILTNSLGLGVFISKAEVFKINKKVFENSSYYSIESPFAPNRPGEMFLHPIMPASASTITKSDGTTIARPLSRLFYANSKFVADKKAVTPYVNLTEQSALYNYNRYKYYISDGDTGANVIRAQYTKYIDINKIVVKASNAVTDSTKFSGSVQILGPQNAVIQTVQFDAGAFNANGIMVLYYNGSSWSTNRGNWTPPKLTESGILQFVTSSVTGLIYNQNKATTLNPTFATEFKKINGDPNTVLDSHIIEISPRLEIDMSDLTKSIKVDKQMDDKDSAAGLPMGFMNANSGAIELSNIPVYKNQFPHTLFEPLSENATFSDVIRQGVKFTLMLTSPNNDFTDTIPFATMYADSWSITGLEHISVDLFDTAKYYLMAIEAPDTFVENESISEVISIILEMSGVSDYDYDSLQSILNSNTNHINSFWTSNKETTFDALRNLFVANQIGASFDEYGILRFYNLDEYIYNYVSSNFTPEFAVTDVPLTITANSGSIIYESNLIQGSFNPTVDRKIGKITLNYKIPQISMSNDKSDIMGKKTIAPAAAFAESGTVGLISSYTNKSVLSTDNYISTDPAISFGPNGVRNTVGELPGLAFLRGELVSWKAQEWTFSGNFRSFNKVIFNISDIDETIRRLVLIDPTTSSVGYQFTGKLIGVERGKKLTSIRNHYLYHDSTSKSDGYYTSYDSNLDTYIQHYRLFRSGAGITTIDDGIHSGAINFINNICNFKLEIGAADSGGNGYPLVIIPRTNTSNSKAISVPTSASNFNYYSFTFSSDSNYINKIFYTMGGPIVETGLFIKYLNAWNSTNKSLLIGIQGYSDSISATNSSKVLKAKIVCNGLSDFIFANDVEIPCPINVFDAKNHTIGIAINYSNSFLPTVQVFVDNVLIHGVDTNGKNISNDFTDYIRLKSGNTTDVSSKAYDWGVYAMNCNTDSTSINSVGGGIKTDIMTMYLKEMYAFKYNGVSPFTSAMKQHFETDAVNYHWQISWFLDNLVQGVPSEPTYYYWGPNTLTGAYLYNKTEYTTSPAKPGTEVTNFTGYNPATIVTSGGAPVLTTVKKNDVTHSHIFGSPFRFSQMWVNNTKGDKQLVYLGTSDQKVGNGTMHNVSIDAKFYKASESKTLERTIDPLNMQNSVTLSSDWIQSEDQASRLISKMMYFANTFNETISVQIFGNPLIQVGDVCQLVYTVKKIGYDPESTGVIPKYFLVKQVSNDFDSGLTTNLTLKPMFDKNY